MNMCTHTHTLHNLTDDSVLLHTPLLVEPTPILPSFKTHRYMLQLL